ncbi:MAG: flippase-like domain-containing protein [Verrucomicrobia bacterium]|nr:flippase-like domain-containing protein [Verrucomicrobiota bacterium]
MNRGSKTFGIAWRLGVGGILLVWIFHSIFMVEGRQTWKDMGQAWEQLSRWKQWTVAWSYGPGKLWSTLSLVGLPGLILSLVCMGMTILLGVMRWRLVLHLQGLNLSFGRAAEISWVAHFFNSFLLGSTGGDLLKAYYAARETHHKKAEAVTTVFIDRLVGLFAMLLFACLMIGANLSLVRGNAPLRVLAGFIGLMMLGCATAVGLSLWGGVSRWWPRARHWLRQRPKGELFERGLDAAHLLGKNPFLLVRVFLLSMALNVFCVLQVMALAWGLGLTIPARALFVIVPAIVCISAMPISPSGLGVRENLYVLALGVPEIKVDATAALALSLLAYAGSLLWSILGGIVYVVRKDRDRLAEVAENAGQTHLNSP